MRRHTPARANAALIPAPTFGSVFRRERERSGHDYHRIANNVGASKADVRAWERGDALPNHVQLQKLCGQFHRLRYYLHLIPRGKGLDVVVGVLGERGEAPEEEAPPLPPRSFADALRVLRVREGLDQGELAALVKAEGVTGQAVSHWECGRNEPVREHYEALVKLLPDLVGYPQPESHRETASNGGKGQSRGARQAHVQPAQVAPPPPMPREPPPPPPAESQDRGETTLRPGDWSPMTDDELRAIPTRYGTRVPETVGRLLATIAARDILIADLRDRLGRHTDVRGHVRTLDLPPQTPAQDETGVSRLDAKLDELKELVEEALTRPEASPASTPQQAVPEKEEPKPEPMVTVGAAVIVRWTAVVARIRADGATAQNVRDLLALARVLGLSTDQVVDAIGT